MEDSLDTFEMEDERFTQVVHANFNNGSSMRLDRGYWGIETCLGLIEVVRMPRLSSLSNLNSPI